ncbi:MAG: T9SS type A sorting domain-containing protein [Crocinitomicaceae bacterium]|nr:T9SS type A sorting domain-containing protein [Crocinitomicaceae bacterium]
MKSYQARILLILMLIGSMIPLSSKAQILYDEQKMVASDRNKEDNFGGHVRIYEDFAFVQAYDAGPKNSGRVYVYVKDANGNWVQDQILESAINYKGDNFGSNIERSGNTIIIGANSYGTSHKGAAFFFELDETGKWIEKQSVSSYRPYDTGFGVDVAISGDYAIVGAYAQNDGTKNDPNLKHAGAAYIYKKGTDGKWTLHQEIYANNREAEAFFGHTVFMEGNVASVGAIYDNYDACKNDSINQAGAVFMYELEETGYWKFKQEISPSDRRPRDFFGYEIFMQKDEMFVTANRHSPVDGLDTKGVIYYYKKNAQNGLWCEKQKILSPTAQKKDYFGHSIASNGNVMVSGSAWWMQDKKGEVLVFVKNNCGEWVFTQSITASDGKTGDRYGRYVGISGSSVIIGSSDNDFAEPNSTMINNGGAAYFYKISRFDVNPLPCKSKNENDALCSPCQAQTNVVEGSYDIPLDTTATSENETVDTNVIDNNEPVTVVDITVTISILNCKTVLTANEENASYQWIDCDSGLPIQGETNRSFIPTKDGSYAVDLKNENSEGTSHCFEIKVKSAQVQPPNEKPQFTVSPNPNYGQFEVTILGEVSGIYHIVIKSPFGMVIKELKTTEKLTNIDLGRVTAGTYLVKVTRNGLSSTIPIIVKSQATDTNGRN